MAPLKILLASLCALTLAACATAKPGPAPRPGPRPTPAPAPAPVLEQFSDLPGWAADDHAAAFEAYRSTCGAARDAAMGEICRRARARPLLSGPEARAFFEDNFRPEAVPGEGVLTAYYAPEYEARARADAEFSAPVRPKPVDLVSSGQGGRDAQQRGPDGKLGPYPDRTAIETSPPTQVLAWMRPEELFFLQVQGSGVVTYPDGRRVKVLFAATNGRTFTGIANPMRDRGLLAANNTSGEAIRQWLADHRGPEADAIMRLNPRYVFFTTAPDDGRPPVGSAGIPLPTGRAIAVDPSRHAS
ncbi:MAG TPA: MltA domain-containing protein, partial [Phenylobacterium sp.]|nr:MltA domain-containing protein [Phenylobacterium sp.]